VIRSSRITSISTVVLLLLASVAAAQPQAGSVVGRVVDQTGAALPDVIIDLVVGSRELTVSTDGQGRFRFDPVPPGAAELTFRLLNFNIVRRRIQVAAAQTALGDVVLTLAMSADVVVTGARTFRNIADVENPAENLVGIALAASQGAVTAEQLETRPIMRPGEVLETVPGMIISQHSGEGKANQYYLRGFNLDHGTDFSTMVAGVPVNTPTGAHAHGYSDLSFLIPELVSGVQFKKGPYFADEGDFSAAGAANINYVSQLERPFAEVAGGEEGWARIVAAAAPRVGSGHLLGAIELNHNDGPWVRPDDYRKVNGVARYSRGDNRNGFSVTGMGYSGTWDSTDQVPDRAIASGLIPRFGDIDPSDGGTASRQSAAVEFQRAAGPSMIRASGFVLHDRLDLFSNFTYLLDDPENGDQFEQSESRTAAGGRVTYRRLGHFFERHVESAVGLQLRQDWLDPVALYHTAARQRLAATRVDHLDQTMTGVYAQTEIEWARTLRTMIGIRGDVYRFSVRSDNAANSGNGDAGIVSPKIGAVLGPWSGTELYANAGSGFHSNDARGAVTRVDPKTGEAVDPVTPLVRARGAEVGVRTVRVPRLQSTVAVWYLGLDSELLFVGDAGTTEPGRPSRRTGVEWTNYARITPWLRVDGDFAFTRARFTDQAGEGSDIPGAVGRVISAGADVGSTERISASVRVRHFGPRPLTEDGRVTSQATTLWNSEAGYRVSRNARVRVELFNLFDAAASDIDYFYASRLAGEPADGVADVHTHPALPRSVRVSLQVSF